METAESHHGKQTRTRLTFAQKVQVLQRLENGEKQVTLAKELGCSRRALSRLKQDKAFFLQLQLKPADSQRKSRQPVRNFQLESDLNSFLSTAKQNGFPVTSTVVRNVAIKIRDEMLADPELPSSIRTPLQIFQASMNWSKAFSRRKMLRNAQNTQQESSEQSHKSLNPHFTHLLREYDLDCILSVEHFNLFYQTLPSDLLSQSQVPDPHDENARKYTLQERVAVLVSANTTGSLKILPTIVWSEKTPSCFERRPCPLPHLYHPYAWIDEDVFKTWFYTVLLPAVRKYTSKKVALLVREDWVPADISDNQDQVQVLAVPQGEIDFVGPLHMGVISVLRRAYRYSLLDVVIQMISSGYERSHSGFGQIAHSGGLVEGQTANLLDLTDLLYVAWCSTGEALVGKCWTKCGILFEDHNRALLETFGRYSETSGAELYANCCTRAKLEHVRALERMLVDSRVALPKGCIRSARAVELVNKLNQVHQRELDAWFGIEDTLRGQRALGSELNEVIDRVECRSFTNKVRRQTVEEVVSDTPSDDETERRRKRRRTGTRLPSAGYLLELIAPLEGVLDGREGEKVGQLLKSLKMELIRLKCGEEGTISHELE